MALQSCSTLSVGIQAPVVDAAGSTKCRTPPAQFACASSNTCLNSRSLRQEQVQNCFTDCIGVTSFFGRRILSRPFKWKAQATANSRGARAMFTGLVEEMGKVRELKTVANDGVEMTIEASVVLEEVKLGDSIAVNGTCLTVIRFDSESFAVGLAPETLRKTSLGEAEIGSFVNLERSVLPNTRMGGHFVQGHVDGTGTIVSFEPEGDSLWVKIKTSPDLLRYVVPKGYIAVDGTSLTVVKVLDDESCFTFMLVAYTQQKIVVPLKSVGSKVNLEVDIVGKYVERLLQGYRGDTASIQSPQPGATLPALS